MKLSQFNFELPEALVAQYPKDKRDESRLMVLHRENRTIEHKSFKDVVDYFEEGDLILLNNSRVFPALFRGNKEKTGAPIEVFLLRELDPENMLWDVLVNPARKIRIGNKLFFGDNEDLVAEVIDNTTNRGRTIKFLFDGTVAELKAKIHTFGETPIPEYIKRPVEELDKERYQTIYATEEGAVVAPAAGLHFSRNLMKRLEIKGVDFPKMTLHVGRGTFTKVEVEDLNKHRMDSEQFVLSESFAKKVNKAITDEKRICAVGTTVMRAIESSVNPSGLLNPYEGWTQRFIFPPYRFSIANAMITNLHIPKSTLMMMACAFGGFDFVMEAYKKAVKEKYRFCTYGDAMLIL